MQTNAQNSSFISTRLFRKYVTLLSKMITMPETVTLNIAGTAKEFSVFHRFEFINLGSDDAAKIPQLLVRSYPISAVVDEDPTGEQQVIRPEYEFSRNSIFWAAVGNRVFKDYQPMLDKKFGNFSWCYGYERELIHEQFVISQDNMLQEMLVNLSVLERLDLPETARVSVGSVDEDGNVTEPKSATPIRRDKPTARTGAMQESGPIDTPKGTNWTKIGAYGVGGDGTKVHTDTIGTNRRGNPTEADRLRQLRAQFAAEEANFLQSKDIVTTTSVRSQQPGIMQYIKDMLSGMKSPQIS